MLLTSCTVSLIFTLGMQYNTPNVNTIQIAEIPILKNRYYQIEPDMRFYTTARPFPKLASVGITYQYANNGGTIAAYSDEDVIKFGINDNLQVNTSRTHLNFTFGPMLPFGGRSEPNINGHDFIHQGSLSFTYLSAAFDTSMKIYLEKDGDTNVLYRTGSNIKITECKADVTTKQ